METGQLIKELRIKKGFTQEELADLTGMSERSIQRIESGNVTPRSYSLRKIADALEVPYEDLTSDDAISNSDIFWLIALHLSGLLFMAFPPTIIWVLKRDEVDNLHEHAVDVINFQINLLLIMVPCGIFAILMITIPILIITAIIGCVVIIINVIRVALKLPYKYPVFYSFLKV